MSVVAPFDQSRSMQRLSLAVHVLLVGCDDTPNPALKWADIIEYCDQLLTKSGMSCPVSWFGRLLAEALVQDCQLDGCTIDHSRALISQDRKTLQFLRSSIRSDFMPRKPTRRNPHPPVPACAVAYASLREHIPRLCSFALEAKHGADSCGEGIHIHNVLKTEPIIFDKNPSMQSAVVSFVLHRCVEEARNASGTRNAKARASSEELVNVLEAALSQPSLPPIVRAKALQGGLFSRHAMGRLVCSSAVWGEAKRNAQARAFLGFRIKTGRDEAKKLQSEVLAQFGDKSAQALEPVASSQQLPAPSDDDRSTVTLTAEQYAFLFSNARAGAQHQTAADSKRVADIDRQISALQAQRAAAVAVAARNADTLARIPASRAS